MIQFSKQLLDFLKEPNYMVLATLGKDGTPQLTIVWFEYAGGVFKVSTTTPRVKYKNVSRDPRVSFIIYDRGNPYRYLQVSGNVTNITREGGHDLIDHLSGRYTANTTYKYDPERKEDRVIISITPEKYYAVGFPQE